MCVNTSQTLVDRRLSTGDSAPERGANIDGGVTVDGDQNWRRGRPTVA